MTTDSNPSAELALQVENLDVYYGAIHALRGASLRVGAGQVVALVGANGAGKTTTLRAISGMLRPSGGAIRLFGQDIARMRAHQLVPMGMAHAPEGRGVFPALSVRENLELGAYTRHNRAEVEHDLETAFALFPILRDRQPQRAGTLSGGEQQMLAVARALMSRPRLLLLDEPSLGLAPQIVETIFRTLREINQHGVSILLVEQNAVKALELAHYAYVLETGTIAMEGPGRDLLASDEVRKAYLGEG